MDQKEDAIWKKAEADQMHSTNAPIYFHCDASHDIGSGHLVRCLSLASAFRRFGSMDPTFITGNMLNNFSRPIKQNGFKHFILDDSIGVKDKASEEISIINKNQHVTTPICIVDSYSITEDYEEKLKSEGIIVIAIDDMADRNFCSDMIINYHLGARIALYKHATNTRFLLGVSYTPLRNDFVDVSSSPRSFDATNQILVTLGSGSLANQIISNIIIKSLCILKNRMDLSATIIASLTKKDEEAVMKYARASGLKLEILSNVTNMAKIMLKSHFAIAAGGITAYELAACGLPSLLFILGENQKNVVESFEREGICVNLGWHENVSSEMLADAICNLTNDSIKYRKMSHLGQKMVDGKGCMRIVEEVIKFYC